MGVYALDPIDYNSLKVTEKVNEMKNFALFAGEDYYPSGGMDDLVGLFDSVDEAVIGAIDTAADEDFLGYDWYQVVDLTTFTVVARG